MNNMLDIILKEVGEEDFSIEVVLIVDEYVTGVADTAVCII
jgi:hypothetical protein